MTCAVDGCEARVVCRGWCDKHYTRWKRHGDPLTMIHGLPWRQRLADKFKRAGASDCWPWRDKPNHDGYGSFHLDDAKRSSRLAHVVVYESLVGPVPTGLELDHLCRNRLCVNPGHLEPVTHAENMRRGAHARKTRCKYGHPFDSTNTLRPSNHPTWRRCRACKAIANA